MALFLFDQIFGSKTFILEVVEIFGMEVPVSVEHSDSKL